MKKILVLMLSLTVLFGCNPKVEEQQPEEVVKVAMPEFKFGDASEDATLDEDGYAIATLTSCVDGDTATFNIDGVNYDTRFLGVDTPETSHPTLGREPWGYAAKDYTCNALTNATQIVIERDPAADLFDHYGRLLGLIWVDGELLNYKLIEESLAFAKYLTDGSDYTPIFIRIEAEAKKTKSKVHGEKDPDYNYDDNVIVTDIASLSEIENGKTVKVKGIITAVLGQNMYIQDGEHAIYIYANKYTYRAAVVGNEVELTADLAEYASQRQLTNVEEKIIEVLSEGNELPEVKEITLDQLNEDFESRYVTLKDLEVVSVPESNEGGFSVEVKNGELEGIVRIDKYLDPMIETSFFEVGTTIDVIGVVGQYNETYQLMIRTEADVTRK